MNPDDDHVDPANIDDMGFCLVALFYQISPDPSISGLEWKEGAHRPA